MIRNAFTCLVLLGTIAAAVVAQPRPAYFSSDSSLIVVPFKDQSGFSGKWNPSMDVPRFLSAYLTERFRIGVINPVSVREFAMVNALDTTRLDEIFFLKQYAEHFKTRYIITGTIEDFSIERFMVSEVQLAGYEAFSATVRISFTLIDAMKFGKTGTASVIYDGESEGIVKDRSLGITLFGKRTDRTSEYFSLDELAFGSEEFNKTIIGEALFKCADDLGTKMERAVPGLVSRSVVLSSSVVIDSSHSSSPITVKRQLISGEIVVVDNDEVFLNLGSADRISVGDVLPVFTSGNTVADPKTGEDLGTTDEKVGEVQVIEVRAEHLSLATILSGKERIKPKQRIRKVIVR